MKHQGEILEKAIRNSGFSIALLAKKIGYSRRHFYNLFQNEKITIDIFLKVGKIINHDFTNEIKDLAQIKNTFSSTQEDAEYWKNKYLLLLEKFNELLSGGIQKGVTKKK